VPRSLAERFGERVGYFLAFVVLGPHAAIERRARRRMRRAMLAWCEQFEPRMVAAPNDTLRRAVVVTSDDAPPLSLDVDLEPFASRARVVATIEPLPPRVKAHVSRALWELTDKRYPLGPAFTNDEGWRVDSDTLDALEARELLATILASPLEHVRPAHLHIAGERVELRIKAPNDEAEWERIGNAMTKVALWIGRRWGARSYRS
jgi:hypothetical protein